MSFLSEGVHLLPNSWARFKAEMDHVRELVDNLREKRAQLNDPDANWEKILGEIAEIEEDVTKHLTKSAKSRQAPAEEVRAIEDVR